MSLRTSLFSFLILITICFQFTDVKILNVKISEFLMLLAIPFILYFNSSINRYIFFFFLFFSLLVLSTFAKNFFQDFYLDVNHITFLKKPFLITISRYLELIACLAFAIFTYRGFIFYNKKGIPVFFMLKQLLVINAVLGVFFIISFLLAKSGLIPVENSVFSYYTAPGEVRLKGLYIEGGPLGLLFAFLFCLAGFLPARNFLIKLIFLIVIFMAQSKGGYLLLVAWYLFKAYTNIKYNHVRLISLLLIVPVFFMSLYLIVNNYFEVIGDLEILIKERQNDLNFVMGRIAAVFIVPNMLIENPFLGVGMGNYALVRNNETYLGIFPAVEQWDSPGLGGLITLLAENGLIGLIGFLVIYFLLYTHFKKESKYSVRLILLFLLPCLLGVQLHFMYIWFAIGLAIVYSYNQNVRLSTSV